MLRALTVTLGLLGACPPSTAQTGMATILDAREALRVKDRSALLAARTAAVASQHPLALWVEYWELTNRLDSAQQEELDAFYARWRGTYVEDRLRNDWLLELGRRGDWGNFKVDFPRFVMNDDREVSCYVLLVAHMDGRDVVEAAREAWWSQRVPDKGCASLAQTLYDAKLFTAADVWHKARSAVAASRPLTAKPALDLLGRGTAILATQALDNPARFVKQRGGYRGRTNAELATLALMRLAANDFEATAAHLVKRWERRLPNDLLAWAWAATAKHAALKHASQAPEYFLRVEQWARKSQAGFDWPHDMLAWQARAALRSPPAHRWSKVILAIAAMSPDEQSDPTWVYWQARALDALSKHLAGDNDQAQRARSQQLLASIAGQLHFYGMLAAEELGRPVSLPARPSALSGQERKAAAGHPGLQRALLLIDSGLRSEGVREWNFSLRGMGDRELLAAAQLACERAVWDRCISTSERTRAEIDLQQRFPMPFRNQVLARARDIDLDPAYVYGLIRQESRFILDARSSAGASGLMQLMPATAKWTAKKLGLEFAPTLLTDQIANLTLGTGYLKLVLDAFSGSQTMAAAGYNAGPNRPRRWRQGPTLEAAIWAENIPFSETREYVKKVLANATVYAALLNGSVPSLKERLGGMIGPREDNETAEAKALP
ncbi:MAG: lytic transglycosylase domain-containing protein [Burkholderiaceae bacterium]|nr:lytic transglycosylase domain-containing protein [Burkholderiaceae bacterium]